MKLFQGPGRLLSLDLTYASNFSYLALVDMLLILGDYLNVYEEKEGASNGDADVQASPWSPNTPQGK